MTGTFSVCVTSGGLYRRCSSGGACTYTLISWAKSQRSLSVVVIALRYGHREQKAVTAGFGPRVDLLGCVLQGLLARHPDTPAESLVDEAVAVVDAALDKLQWPNGKPYG